MKVVINSCYGGFDLSAAGVRRYAEHAGLTLYPFSNEIHTREWTPVGWDEADNEFLPFYVSNKNCPDKTIFPVQDIPRDDEALILTVQELGMRASGKFANLQIIEIPDDVDWEVEEYDGNEWIAEKHRTWR